MLTKLSSCPLCGATPERFRNITQDGAHFSGEKVVICLSCGLVFLNPRMSLDTLIEYYRTDTFSAELRGNRTPDPAAIEYRDARAQRRWEHLKHLLPPMGRCLEIGCGSGNFLSILKDQMFQVFGIDPSEGYARYAQEAGLNVVSGSFPVDLPAGHESFDIIAAFHSLEHVNDPLNTLREIRKRLAGRGLLLLEYPDVTKAVNRSYLASTYFQKSHLFDFSPDTIEAMLTIAGFRIEHTFSERDFPFDKNVLLTVRVAQPAPISTWNSHKAQLLHRVLRRKMFLHKVLHFIGSTRTSMASPFRWLSHKLLQNHKLSSL